MSLSHLEHDHDYYGYDDDDHHHHHYHRLITLSNPNSVVLYFIFGPCFVHLLILFSTYLVSLCIWNYICCGQFYSINYLSPSEGRWFDPSWCQWIFH